MLGKGRAGLELIITDHYKGVRGSTKRQNERYVTVEHFLTSFTHLRSCFRLLDNTNNKVKSFSGIGILLQVFLF